MELGETLFGWASRCSTCLCSFIWSRPSGVLHKCREDVRLGDEADTQRGGWRQAIRPAIERHRWASAFLPDRRAKFILVWFAMKTRPVFLLPVLLLATAHCFAAQSTPRAPMASADVALAEYFRLETGKLSLKCLAEIRTAEDWQRRREQLRQEAREMFGLWPSPPRTDLKPVVTGGVEHEALRVENLHFQAIPGLYVTANLYLPKNLSKPAPTVLYVCGHGPVISNKVSYGNKVSYQHHGAWFARNGYVCLVIDTVQWGELLGVHHGTYRDGMWWWNSRGYTPAGVEAWSAIRALDYLSTRPEVDTNRFGITGRSGGGAYSWFAAALDDRVKVIAPVAGITDLENHVVDGAVEGHCDCMFFVNTHRWDYPALAALSAPRPLLLVNTDADSIFPLNGVMRTHAKVKRIYDICRASNSLGLVIAPGPHKDTQDLQVPVFRWFNRHLKGEDPVIEMAAIRLFRPEQLKVFREIPSDAINTNVHHTFVPRVVTPPVPESVAGWERQRDQWSKGLREQVFVGWPASANPVALERRILAERKGLRFQAFDFESQPAVKLRLYTLESTGVRKPEGLRLTIIGDAGAKDVPKGCPAFPDWLAMMRPEFDWELSEERVALAPVPAADGRAWSALQRSLTTNNTIIAWVAPRAVGLTAWTGDVRKQTHLRRRFMLLGQTLDGMRVWDIRRTAQALRSVRGWESLPMTIAAERDMACNALYAALFEPEIQTLDLWRIPSSHERGPDYLNVLRILDVPQAAAMAAEKSRLRFHDCAPEDWAFVRRLTGLTGWPKDPVVFLD